MSRLFISHASADNAAAIALKDWLAEQGFDDVFLDVDPKRGLAPGERWQEALRAAADRCEAVLFLVSPTWLESKWCLAELMLCKTLHKRIFGLIIEPVPIERVPAEMTAEWQLCELVGEDRLRGFVVDAGASQERVAFREAGLELLRRGLERAGLDAKSFPWPPANERDRAPYRGLRALEPQDAAIFFGREVAIVRGLDRIRGMVEQGTESLLIVLGASGSGKSSFLRAGLWPRLARDDVAFRPLLPIRPEAAVISGRSGLVAALEAAFRSLGTPRAAGHIKEALAEGAGGLARLLEEISAGARRRLIGLDAAQPGPAIVLSIDQAEELFNPDGAAEAATFLELLGGMLAPRDPAAGWRVLVVATMRSDRYELLQAEPRLAAIRQDLFNLPPLPAAEFKTVIEGPAQRAVAAGGRLAVDPELTERLIADAQGADALPLLAFTLERLYADFGAIGRLTLVEYQKLGGVQGSLEAAIAHALGEPGRLPAIPPGKEEQLACLRVAFIPWLARIDPETGAPMRRVARLDEIPQGSRGMVERLVAARLLVADRRDGADVIEVAHESLLRRWPALASWLEADADDLKGVEGIERAAGEWARNGRLEAWLDHRAERLAAGERLLGREDFRQRVGEVGADYVAACRAREQAERRQREDALAREQARLAEVAAAQARTARIQRLARWALAAVAIAVAVGLGLGVWQRSTNLALQASLDTRQRDLDHARANLHAELAAVERLNGNLDGAMRLAAYGAGLDLKLGRRGSAAQAELATVVARSAWRLILRGHEDVVRSARFSPDGSRIVTAAADGTARIWDAATGNAVVVVGGLEDIPFAGTVLHAENDKLSSAAFSPDGTRIVTVPWGRNARVWDAASGKELGAFGVEGTYQIVDGADFSRDGTRVVLAFEDKTARIFDIASGQEIAVLRGHEGELRSAAFSPDGTHVVTGSVDRTARIWDRATAREIVVLRGHDSAVTSAAFSPDGSRVVTASSDNTVRIWDAATGKEIASFQGHNGPVSSAAFSPDGSRIVSASNDRTARLWDATGVRETLALKVPDQLVTSAAFNADGSRVITASADSTPRIWDARTGQAMTVLPQQSGAWSAALSPDGSRILVAAGNSAQLLAADSGRELMALTGHDNTVTAAAFSADGRRIVTSSWDLTGRVWDAATGQAVSVLRGHRDFVLSAALSADGARAVTTSSDTTARVWDAASGTELLVLQGHGRPVRTAAFSPDGSRIVTGSWDTTARIWDATTGQEIAVLHGHQNQVQSAAFSRDGSRIVTSSWDGTARVWDAATAKEIAVLRGHDKSVVSAAFSPDGSRVLTAGDTTARIWDTRFATMATRDLLVEVCTRRLAGFTRLTRDEMRLAGYPDATPEIDVCAAID